MYMTCVNYHKMNLYPILKMDNSTSRRHGLLSPGEVDYVLVYTKEHDHINKFLEQLQRQYEIIVDTETFGEHTYIKLRASFHTLCAEAENVKLEMPLAGAKAAKSNFMFLKLHNWIQRTFVTDDEDDYISAPFMASELDKFKGHQNKNTFFRRSLRSLLVHHILCNIDIVTSDEEEPVTTYKRHRCSCLTCCRVRRNSDFKKKKGLNYFLMKGIFTDFLVLHEDPDTLAIQPRNIYSTSNSVIDNFQDCVASNPSIANSYVNQMSHDSCDYKFRQTDTGSLEGAPETMKNEVTAMIETWTSWKNFYKFQPLWKIRNYFGEKIAFYFAWTGMLVSSLWIPTFIGFIVLAYGLALTLRPGSENSLSNSSANSTSSLKSQIYELMKIIHLTFDNDMTPYFAMIVCIWGTIFLELWKRRSARLAYEWDVNDFQASEPDRPQFIGTTCKENPVGDEKLWYYPFRLQLGKFMISMIAALVMIGVVVASLIGVIVYRVTMDMDVCPDTTPEQCLTLKTGFSAVLNAVSITALGKVYHYLAIWLTNKENHKTQSKYDDALIIKLFAFQFANSYSSCFYIAFFIERLDISAITGRDSDYRETCEGTCMSQLTFQIIALMFIKPIPKFCMDVIVPKLRKVWKRLSCCECCMGRKGDKPSHDNPEAGHSLTKNINNHNSTEEKTCIICKDAIRPVDDNGTGKHVLCGEQEKPELDDFTLGEYTEKVIQYGYLMLFAASFPLAPLFALLTNLIDIQVDGWRMLTIYRRPLAFIAQDIGMWYNILIFVNYCGVLSNAFIVAFTSSWGHSYDLTGKLIIVIGFEHIVFVLKYILSYLIPDVPVDVQEAIRKEKYETRKIFHNAHRHTERRAST